MNFIDALLNLAVVLLWLQWRALRTAQPPLPSKSLLSLLQPTDKPMAGARLLVFIAAIVVLRALFYWLIGGPLGWTGYLSFGTARVPFRSEFLGLMLIYSPLAAIHAVVVMYCWLLLLSVVNRAKGDAEPFQHWTQHHLGRTGRLPLPVKLCLPMLVTALAWLALYIPLAGLQLVPRAASAARLAAEAAVIGAGAVLAWKWLLLGVLGLYVLHSYVYFGAQPFWGYVDLTGRNLLKPLARLPLRAGKVDLAPLLLLALVWGTAWWLAHADYGLPRSLRALRAAPL